MLTGLEYYIGYQNRERFDYLSTSSFHKMCKQACNLYMRYSGCQILMGLKYYLPNDDEPKFQQIFCSGERALLNIYYRGRCVVSTHSLSHLVFNLHHELVLDETTLKAIRTYESVVGVRNCDLCFFEPTHPLILPFTNIPYIPTRHQWKKSINQTIDWMKEGF